jgi:hypothetical protein
MSCEARRGAVRHWGNARRAAITSCQASDETGVQRHFALAAGHLILSLGSVAALPLTLCMSTIFYVFNIRSGIANSKNTRSKVAQFGSPSMALSILEIAVVITNADSLSD